MRVARLVLSLSVSFPVSISLAAQQTATSSPQALLLLQQSLRALVGGQTLSDVTLSGTARRIAGSDDETGTVVLKAASSGALRLDFSYPSGPRAELRSAATTDALPTGAWSGPDGAAHPIALHNLANDWGLVPAFTVANALSAKNGLTTYIGHETRDGQSVLHLRASRQFPQVRGNAANLLQHLSEMDIFFDAASLLPVAITYSTHPDDNAGLDIPVEIRLSDYRAVNGVKVPFHIERYINGTLQLEITVANVVLNPGLSVSDFVPSTN